MSLPQSIITKNNVFIEKEVDKSDKRWPLVFTLRKLFIIMNLISKGGKYETK